MLHELIIKPEPLQNPRHMVTHSCGASNPSTGVPIAQGETALDTSVYKRFERRRPNLSAGCAERYHRQEGYDNEKLNWLKD